MATTSNPRKVDDVRKAADRLSSEARSADQLMENISLLLNKQMLKYNWVGFYMLEAGASPPTLVLGRYQGAMTVHTDRKSTRLNSSHANISYAVFCLKTK